MSPRSKVYQLGRAMAFSILFSAVAASQSTQFQVGSVPVGLQPLGIDIAYGPMNGGTQTHAAAIVANSGDNSVTILYINGAQSGITINPTTTKVTGIPAPYGFAACAGANGFEYVLVTSPADNSVRVLTMPVVGTSGTVTISKPVSVGPQPRSVLCDGGKGIVSNVDNSLTVLDVASL